MARKRPDTLARRTPGPPRVLDKVAAAMERIPSPDRARLLALAGYDEAKLVAILQRTLDKLTSNLEARSVSRIQKLVGRGQSEIVEYTDDDTNAQLRAVDMLMTFLGAYPSRSSGDVSGSGAVQVNISILQPPASTPADRPVVIDVTPK